MKFMNRFLLHAKNIERSAFLWNAFSAVMNSFQTMILLIVITRTGNTKDASIFVIAYAVGNLMLNVGKYGVRQFQVTDVTEKYKYRDYLHARYISMAIMLTASSLYVLYNIWRNGYTAEKAVIVLLICGVKGVEAFEDVLHGRMQQEGRLDVAGKNLGIRLFLFLVGFAVIYLLSGNLLFTVALNLFFTISISIALNGAVLGIFRDGTEARRDNVKNILWECFPLCVSTCLNMYIANAPKYIIDTAVSDKVQTCFNIVFMPVFVIALLSNFIFQPFLNQFGLRWSQGEISKLKKMIIKLMAVVSGAAVLIVFAGSFLGIPVLQYIYGVNLTEYKLLLVIFMIDGGIIALQNLFIMIVTTVRYQRYMIYGYLAVAGLLLVFGKGVLERTGLLGLCCFYTGMLLVMMFFLMCLMLIGMNKRKSNCERE